MMEFNDNGKSISIVFENTDTMSEKRFAYAMVEQLKVILSLTYNSNHKKE